jgi:RHS repeat-associated protein
VDQAFAHTGLWRDEVTNQLFADARVYDPTTARWLSEDPLGPNASDSANLYRAFANSWPNTADPSGLSPPGNPLNNLYASLAGGFSGNQVAPYKPPVSTFNYVDPIGSLTKPHANVSFSPGASSYQSPSPRGDAVLQQLNEYSFNQNFSKPFGNVAFGSTLVDINYSTTPAPTDSQILSNHFNNPYFHTITRVADDRAAFDRAQDLIQHGDYKQAFLGQLGLGLNAFAENANPLVGQLRALDSLTDKNASLSQKVFDTAFAILDTATFAAGSGASAPLRAATPSRAAIQTGRFQGGLQDVAELQVRTQSQIQATISQTVRTGDTAVYRSLDEAANVNYVGLTSNLERRAAEQLRGKGISIEGIPGLGHLSSADARAVEQVLIETVGLGKNGGTLLNRINSIAKSNPIYSQAIDRGKEILSIVGFPGF